MVDLTEEQKLTWLGIRRTTRQGNDGEVIVAALKENFGAEWGDFFGPYETANPSNFADVETLLTDNGIEQAKAENFVEVFKSVWEDFAAFDTDVRDTSTYQEFALFFGSSNELRGNSVGIYGMSQAGVKVYQSEGIGRSGQVIPAGGVEVYGEEVHFSQSDVEFDTDPPGETEGGVSFQYDYENLDVPDVADRGSTITVSCECTNSSSWRRSATVQLIVDGEVYKNQVVHLERAETTTVEFDWSSDEYGVFEIGIGPLDPQKVTVTHPYEV